MEQPGVLIADDHVMAPEAFKALLEPEYRVLKIVSDGRSLLAAATALRPDVVIFDLGMPVLSGINAGQQLKELLPKAKLVVVTGNEDARVASEALHHWASGYLLRKCIHTELKRAIFEVLHGRLYVTPTMAQKVVDGFIRGSHPVRTKELTQRQRQVLQLLAEGCSMKEAAAVLDITVRTIAFHKYKIMEDFRLRTNADLVRFALRERVILDDTEF